MRTAARQQGGHWWFVLVDGAHARTWATRGEALEDAAFVRRARPAAFVEVTRGPRRKRPDGGGWYVNA